MKKVTSQENRFLKLSGQWFLLLYLGACLAWVIIYTLINNGTDVARKTVNPLYESTYFDVEWGSRVFTYLGVFYIMTGFVSLLCLKYNMNLPSVHPSWIRPIPLPWTKEYWNAIEILAIMLFLLVVVLATYLIRDAKIIEPYWFSDWPEDKVWYQWSISTGRTTALTLSVLLLPVSKSCFWWEVLNYKFEKCIKLHRWLAWFLVLVTIVHAATGIVAFAMRGQFFNCMWPSDQCDKYGYGTWNSQELSRRMTYGWVALLLLVVVAITSINYFRRKKYELFFYMHLLFVPFFIFVHLHYDLMISYTAPSLAAYILDKVIWWFCSRRPVTLLELSRPAPGYVRMIIAKDTNYVFEPGQWIRINVPAISKLQWHPMSISSAPKHASFTIDVKVLGDWTKKLEELAANYDPGNPDHKNVHVDYFHGSSHAQGRHGFLTHQAVVCISGGIGCTPMMSAMRSLVEDRKSFPNIRRFVYVWVVKEESVLGLYKEELARIQAMDRSEMAGRHIEVDVYVTLSGKETVTEYSAVKSPSEITERSSKAAKNFPQLQKSLFGYGHMLILTISAGSYFLVGILLANAISYNSDWGVEILILLRLILASVLTAISVSWSVVFGRWLCGEAVAKESYTLRTSNENSTSSTLLSVDDDLLSELQVTRGCRPDIPVILGQTKEWCDANGVSTVGVAVLGPQVMSQAVIDASRECSSDSVQFVVDVETFEW